jgi:hypothetical protein
LADTHDHAPRRPTRRQLLSLAAAGSTAAAITAVTDSGAGTASAQAIEPIVGSWLSVYHRSSGEVITGLLTLHGDGTFVSTASDHLSRSPAHGHWMRLGDHQYAYSVSSLSFDSTGDYTGITALDGEITVDPSGKTWTSISRVNYYDASGNLFRTTSSEATAVRLPLLRRTDPAPPTIDLPSSQ